MVVVVDVPDLQGLAALQLGGPDAGVEEFLGQDPLIAFDFAVVTRCVGADPLMTGPAQHFREVVGPVAGTVVGHDAVDVVDAVGGEECPGPVPTRRFGSCTGPGHSLPWAAKNALARCMNRTAVSAFSSSRASV